MKVRDVLRRPKADGWYRIKSRGGHRQFKHGTKPGRVTVSGKLSDTIPPKTLGSIERQAGWSEDRPMRRFAIIVENAGDNLAAYVPDLPGCVATGRTPGELKRRIRAAITMHLEGMAEDGLPIPEPTTRVATVEVDA